jgi:hypothetical protein
MISASGVFLLVATFNVAHRGTRRTFSVSGDCLCQYSFVTYSDSDVYPRRIRQIAERLALKSSAIFRETARFTSSLRNAILEGKLETVDFLIRHGVDVNERLPCMLYSPYHSAAHEICSRIILVQVPVTTTICSTNQQHPHDKLFK